jgi:hypothetical protein
MFKQKISIGLLSIFLLTSVLAIAVSVSAQDIPAPASGNQEDLSPAPTCEDRYQVLIRNSILAFYEITDNTLQSANQQSEILNYLFKQYRQTQAELTLIKKEANRQISNKLTEPKDSEEAAGTQACLPIIDQIKSELRFVFLDTYSQVASRKRDIVLFEKLDSINSQFEPAQDNIQSITSDLNQFNDLLPCFVTSCVSR